MSTWSKAVEIIDKHDLWNVLDIRVVHDIRQDIYEALDELHAKGVEVQVLSDKSHYRSRNHPYDIELTHDGEKITMCVWDMPEEKRSAGYSKSETLASDDVYKIVSHNSPAIRESVHTLYVRGALKDHDDYVNAVSFHTVAAATEYFQHITALINKLNVEYKPPPDTDLVPDLLEALEDLADECEGWVNAEYKRDGEVYHPALQRRYDRDMEPVLLARQVIDKARGE